jgi:heat shock protein HslJ
MTQQHTKENIMRKISMFLGTTLLAGLLVGCGLVDWGTSHAGLVGTSWELTQINGSPVLPNTTITLNFDAEGRVGGSAGCNNYGGDYSLANGGIQFGMLFSTMMACMEDGVMQQEQDYLALLESMTTYVFSDATLTLTADDGRTLFFTRSTS